MVAFKHVAVTIDVISKQRRVLKRWLKILMPFKLFTFHFLEYFDVNFTVVTAPSELANPKFMS